jgi:prevent-host-death family protein
MEKFLSVREVRRTFATVLKDAAIAQQRVVIVRRGVEVGAVVSMDALEVLRRLERPPS